jgi:uncharacterized membrane protein YagU involved in acid resistance
LRAIPALRLWQNIASSVLGPDSFNRGWTSGIIGLLLHCAVAFTAAFVFVLTAQLFPTILKHEIISGAAFGLLLFVVMNVTIIPLSHMPKRSVPPSLIAIQIIMHMFLVGLPISLSSHYFLSK